MSALDPLVSVVVPVRGDAAALTELLTQMPDRPGVEIVVSATGPRDTADDEIRTRRSDVVWIDGPPGRGVQLNAGAAAATGRWLWFVHADSRLPPGWAEIFGMLEPQASVVGGAFAFRLDASVWQARWLERAVAARVRLFGLPYGDQGLFVRRQVFLSMGGFQPLPLMEDVEFVGRLKRQGRLVHLRQGLTTSARRWEQRGWFRQSLSNLTTLGLYFLGVSPDRLAQRYDRRPKVF